MLGKSEKMMVPIWGRYGCCVKSFGYQFKDGQIVLGNGFMSIGIGER